MSDSDSIPSKIKPKPCFSHLPWNVKQRIVDKTDPITRFTTRKVCKELMSYVDRSSYHYKQLKLELLWQQINLSITDDSGKRTLYYETKSEGNEEDAANDDLYEAPDHIWSAVLDLMILLKSPRVTVETLEFEVDDEYQEDEEFLAEYNKDQELIQRLFKQELNKLNHKLHVNKLSLPISDEEEIMFILPYLQPKTLEEIVVGVVPWETDKRIDRLIETDHWKQAKHVMCQGTNGVPISAMALPESAYFTHGKASLEELKALIQTILESSDKPVTINAIVLEYNLQEFEEYVQKFEETTLSPRIRFVPIPNTELYLRINFMENKLFMQKLTKGELNKI